MRAQLETALEEGKRKADPVEVADADRRLEELLDKVDAPVAEGEAPEVVPAADPSPSVDLPDAQLRTAIALGVKGRQVSVRVRGLADPLFAELDRGVSREVVEQAVVNGDRVLLEQVAGAAPLVVGVVQTCVPEELKLSAKRILIEGDQEVLMRSGRAAMRVRQDGDVELVGSRISAMSRGLFRLVGRVLRLN